MAICSRLTGFVFQSFGLSPRLNVLNNAAPFPSYQGMSCRETLERAEAMLVRIGLAGRAGHRPADLSGDQRQRVVIAYALIGRSALILTDEPTGDLDTSTVKEALELSLTLNRRRQMTLAVVAHGPSLATRLGR